MEKGEKKLQEHIKPSWVVLQSLNGHHINELEWGELWKIKYQLLDHTIKFVIFLIG